MDCMHRTVALAAAAFLWVLPEAAAQTPGSALHPPEASAVTPSLGTLLREQLREQARESALAADAGEWFDRGGTSFRTRHGPWQPGSIRVDTLGVGVWTRDGRQPVMFFGDRAVVHHRITPQRRVGRWRWLALAAGLGAAGAHHFFAPAPRRWQTAAIAAGGVGVSLSLKTLRGRARYFARLQGERGRGIDLRVTQPDRSRLVWALEQYQRQNDRRWRERMQRRAP